jgi:tetratricopeptide (TPR) repeat protein
MQPQTTQLSAEALQRIQELYAQGKYLRAYNYTQQFGPLESWKSTDGRLIAGRLAPQLGSRLLGRKLHHRAFLRDRTHPEAQYYFAWTVLEHRGPLATWRWMKEFGDFGKLEPDVRSDLLALKARLAFSLRDFQIAEELLAEAEKICPGKPWLMVERAYLCEAADRYEEALLAARRARADDHWYRPAIHCLSHMLQLLNQDEEALAFLSEAAQHIEGTSVWCDLAGLQTEMKRFGEARESLDRCVANAPLMDKDFAQWLNALRADVAYHCGNFPVAAEFAKQVEGPFYQRFAERLEKTDGGGKRIQLPVGFVRQHHMTCAPATLSAISKFWQRPAEHLSVAEKICYDGTPAHGERSWAEQNGWATREFRVTQRSAEQLLERGIPFTLATVGPGNAHLQAVIGFDEVRASLIIRDPYHRRTHEFQSEKALEHYISSGPRGMALVPIEKAALLEGIDFPEAELYNALHRLNTSLISLDRTAAQAELEKMKVSASDHRLTLQAQRGLATYDANLSDHLVAVEKLLQQFPKDVNLQLARLGCLRDLVAREKRADALREACAEKDADPLLWREQAYELSLDGREHAAAARWIKRVIRCRPFDAYAIYLEGNLLWSQRRFDEATERYRFAASLDDKKEHFACAYFNATRHLKQADKAMAFLAERFQRLGKLSHFPATSLFWAHSELHQTKTAFEVLEHALTLRPDDGELLLYAADAYARYQNIERAKSLLAKAEGRAQRTHWLRTAATMADYFGELKNALALWRQILEIEPLAVDVNRSIAQLTGETEGPAAALAFLQNVCERFPYNFALHTVWLEWLRMEGETTMEPVLRKLTDIDPINAWAHRELALTLARLEKFEAAFAEAELAITLDPSNPAGFNVRGWMRLHQGKRDEAKTDLRKSISMAVDFGSGINDLLESCSSLAERKEAIAFVEQELIRQVVFGDGLLAFRQVAHPFLSPEELLQSLRKALAERPDLWHAWSATIYQLTDMQRHDEALKLAREAAERFPLLPRLWLDYARVHRARLDSKNEIEALEKALQLNPSWGYAARQLAEAHERNGDLLRSKAVLEENLVRAPLDQFTHGQLADVLWNLGEKSAALSRLQHALKINSDYDWAWKTLRNWARALNQPDLPSQMARELTVKRPGQAHNWLFLARALDLEKDSDESIAALDRALALSPRYGDAWEMKAYLLTLLNRFDDALSACRPPVFGDRVPTFLKAREAWVLMRQGKMSEAIRRMRAVLAEDPSHYWGWKELADWLWETGAHKEAVDAAAQLSRLAPFDPIPLGYSGDMKRRLKDRDGAKNDFKRAMKLSPTYTFAGFALFDLQMEDGETTSAEQTLAFLRPHVSNDWFIAREVQLSAHLRKWNEALEALKKLCTSKETDDGPLRDAVHSFARDNRALEAEKVIEQHMQEPGANTSLGAARVDCHLFRVKWFFPGAVENVTPEGEIRRRAIVRFVEALGENYHRFSTQRDVIYPHLFRFLLGRVLRKHRSWLHEDDWSWGKVGYALASQKKMKAVAAWLGDWKNRKRIEGWMLHNLAFALHEIGRDVEALAVCRHGLTLPFDGKIHQGFNVWVGFEEAIAGNTAAAKAHLSSVNAETLTSALKWIEAFGWAIIEVQSAPEGSRTEAFKKARKAIEGVQNRAWLLKAGRTIRRSYVRTIKRIATDYGSVWPRVWGTFHKFGLLTFSLPILFVSFAGMFFRPEFISVFVLSLLFSLVYRQIKS